MGQVFSKLSDTYIHLLSKLSAAQAKLPVLQMLAAIIVLRGGGSGSSLPARLLRAAPVAWLLYIWAALTRGHRGQSALYLMSHKLLDAPTLRTGGTTAPAFAAVRAAFERNFALGLERGAQFVVYHRGDALPPQRARHGEGSAHAAASGLTI